VGDLGPIEKAGVNGRETVNASGLSECMTEFNSVVKTVLLST